MEMKGVVRALLTILAQIGLISCAIFSNVTIPPYGVKDGTVELGCDFSLESETLLDLKWYQNEREFFRISHFPERHTILTFPLDGVSVDLSKSSLNRVVLRNITLQTSGVYKCDVTIERTFKTLSKERRMVIIAPPSSDPTFSGVHSVVNLGDRITGNCTSYRSKPSASLSIYINDEKAEVPEVIKYPVIRDPDELETSILGFNFLVENRHFTNGIVRLKCTATIGNFYWVKTKNISDANIKAQLSFPGHNRLSSGTQNNPHLTELRVCLCCAFMSGFFQRLTLNFL